VIREIL